MADLRHPVSVTESHQFLVPAARLWMTDPEPHLTAIRLIGREGDEQAVTRLLEALADESFPYRAEAARQLAKIPSSRAVPGLSAALLDADPQVRGESARALGVILKENRIDGIALAALVERLMTALKADPNPLTRYAAYRALASSEDWMTFLGANMLVRQDPHPLLRCAYLEDRAFFALLSGQDSNMRDVAVVAREMLAGSQPWYLRFTLARSFYVSDHPCGVLRVKAVKALGAMRQEEDVATLLALRSDPDAAIREAAVLALAEQQGGFAMRDVLPVLGDPVYAVRARAIALLAGLGERGGEVLGRLLRDGTTFERLRAASALGNVRGQAAALVKALEDDDPQVRRAAKQALITQQEPDSLPILIKTLSAQQMRLRIDAMRVLARYHGEESRTQLIQVLQSGAPPSAPLAAVALGLRGEPEAREALEMALNQAGFPDPIAAVHALQDLQQGASLPALAEFVRDATDFEAKAAAELATAVIAAASS
jgi:HEAT repeat protein